MPQIHGKWNQGHPNRTRKYTGVFTTCPISQLWTKIERLWLNCSFLVFSEGSCQRRFWAGKYSVGNLHDRSSIKLACSWLDQRLQLISNWDRPLLPIDAGDAEIYLCYQIMDVKGVGFWEHKIFLDRCSVPTWSSSASGLWHMSMSSSYIALRLIFFSNISVWRFLSCSNISEPSFSRLFKCCFSSWWRTSRSAW